MDFTLTHIRFGWSNLHTIGQLTNTRLTDGALEPDGVLKAVARGKIRHYHQLYLNRPDPIAFLPVTVDTSDRVYDDFSRLLFLHAHREASVLTNELPEVSDQFLFLRAACLANLKGSMGLIQVWRKLRPWGFLYRSIWHLDILYHYRLSFVLGVPHHF